MSARCEIVAESRAAFLFKVHGKKNEVSARKRGDGRKRVSESEETERGGGEREREGGGRRKTRLIVSVKSSAWQLRCLVGVTHV